MPEADRYPVDGLLDMAGLRKLCPDVQYLGSLLNLALEHLRIDRQRAWQALATREFEHARSRLHRIKGSVCMLCASGHPLIEQFDIVRAALLANDPLRIKQTAEQLAHGIELLEARIVAAIEGLRASSTGTTCGAD